MGFENVSWTEDDKECIYLLENAAYRVSGVGVARAVDLIQQMGMPRGKVCRLIVLENNVPSISLCYKPPSEDTIAPARRDWVVGYNLEDSWGKVRKEKRLNSSLYKVDIVVYPDLSMQNLIITQIYQVLFNLNPAIEISLWRGMKFTGQVIIPIYNDYGSHYKHIRQGYITASQTFRLPHNIFLTATVGTFNANRWGGDVRARYIFERNNRFSVEGRMGYTGVSEFDNWTWIASPLKRFTWTIGANYYWPRFNTQFSVKYEQYLLGEKGLRVDFMRKFRYAGIGFYGMITQHAPKNGGFYFQIALPPYGRYKRKHVRVTPSKYFGISYNAGNELYYGKSYIPELSSIYAYGLDYNPYFIQSELSSDNLYGKKKK